MKISTAVKEEDKNNPSFFNINKFNFSYYVLIFFILLIAWASFEEIDIIVNANGKIITSGQTKLIQNLEGGILKKIQVEEGEIVKKNQLLAVLDDTQFRAAYHRDEVKKVLLEMDIARLNAELQAKNQLDFSNELQKKYPEMTQKIKNIFNLNQTALNNELKTIEASKKLIQKELNLLSPLAKQGIVSQLDIIELQKQYNNLHIQKIQKLEQYRALAREELRQAEEERELLIQTLTATRDRFERTKLYSPVQGVINQIYIRTPGEVIAPGQKIMEIVSLDEPLEIDVYLEPKDIGFIKLHQKANVKITAYDYSIYGYLEATVSHISPDVIVNDKGTGFYEIGLKLKAPYFIHGGKKIELKPGMAASVSIVTGKRSVLSYLLKPIVNASSSALRER